MCPAQTQCQSTPKPQRSRVLIGDMPQKVQEVYQLAQEKNQITVNENVKYVLGVLKVVMLIIHPRIQGIFFLGGSLISHSLSAA